MTKLLLPLISGLMIAYAASAQERVENEQSTVLVNKNVSELATGQVPAKFDKSLRTLIQAQSKEDKALEAYRKRKITNGLILELDTQFSDIRPYVRSMINSCGYVLVSPHRFAKRVYPTIAIDGRMFSGLSEGEHSVTLDLSLVLKSKIREIKAREKMRSYKTSQVDAHRALIAAFDDIGAQMASKGFCVSQQN